MIEHLKQVMSLIWVGATICCALLAFKGCTDFQETWKYTENQRTIQALIINSEPKTFKGMKDSLITILMDR